MARKIKLNQEDMDKLFFMYKKGIGISSLARYFEIARGTVYRYLKNNGEK